MYDVKNSVLYYLWFKNLNHWSLVMHIYITGWSLIQVIILFTCLVLSHYFCQGWLIVIWTLISKLWWNLDQTKKKKKNSFCENPFWTCHCQISAILFRPPWRVENIKAMIYSMTVYFYYFPLEGPSVFPSRSISWLLAVVINVSSWRHWAGLLWRCTVCVMKYA